ncbi:DUF6188 family protein [Streptomyces rhizosphaerihabitans]|uniref:DUF6188 family protein n=1 Tax=Streptomyces rhizosphaerihabitans TaxID=1266770 RepID=UPI0037039FEF
MNDSALAEHEDRWVLGLRGLAVTEIIIDFRLTLLLGSEAWVVLERPSRIGQGLARSDDLQGLSDPGRQDVAAALALFGAKVLSAVAFKTGSLRLVFDNGLHLTCPADPSFETWQVTGPGAGGLCRRRGVSLRCGRPTPGRTPGAEKACRRPGAPLRPPDDRDARGRAPSARVGRGDCLA